jgi:hypothetical protein
VRVRVRVNVRVRVRVRGEDVCFFGRMRVPPMNAIDLIRIIHFR